MRKLPLPGYTAEYTYSTCISRVKDETLKARLEAIAPTIIESASQYEAAAQSNSLHTIGASVSVGDVTAPELSDVYTLRMARKGAPGRHVYDKIFSAPPHGRCPLCGQGKVWTLDHHLPKAYYPAFAVTPANLVPACYDCNKGKLALVPATSAQETLHPYFDHIDDQTWLVASIVESTPAAALFDVLDVVDWSPTLRARVKQHFAVFNLGDLYSGHAAEELTSIKAFVTDLFVAEGSAGVREYLHHIADSRGVARRNSWQTALYRALENSQWYCQGGCAL